MQADYRVDSIYVDKETGEIFAKCYDNVYGENFEKYLGNPEEHQSSYNASIMLEDSNFGMTDELRNEIISTFGLEDLGHETTFNIEDYDDEIYACNANGIVTEDELDAQYGVEESFNLREALNRIDIATDNKFDLRNLYESVDLKDEDKKKLATLIYDQEDPSIIYDTLNDKFLESIGMNEEDESPIIHKKSDGSYLVTSESGDGYTAFSKDDVCQGHISANNENEAKSKFNSNKFDESLNEELGEKITSDIDGSELEINEENVIPNTHSFKATYTTGDSAGNTYIFVEADNAGVEYLKSLGFKAENINGDEFIDLPTECFEGKYEGSYYITRKDFSEYSDLLNEDLGDKWPWTKVYPQLEKAAQDVYISYNWNPDTSLEDTAKMDAEAAKVVKALVDEHKGEADWEEAYRRLLNIAPELELKESVNESTEVIFAGINHNDAEYVTLVKDTEDNIKRLIPQFDYCATIPATSNLIFIENNDESISIDDTGFTSLDQLKDEIKKAIAAEMEQHPDENEYEIEFDVPPYYVYLENISSADEGVKVALEEITNSYVDCDSSSNYMLLNGSNFDTVLNGSSDKFIYTNVKEFLEENGIDESIDNEPTIENVSEAMEYFTNNADNETETPVNSWHDAYKQFLEIVDSIYHGGNEKEVGDAVEALYRQHDGETAWDEAWLRWLDHPLEPGDEGFEEADALYKSELARIRGRKLDESTSSTKTFSQWFDETQCYGDDTEFYPFDNYVKHFPNAEVLRNVTAKDVINNAHKFYDVYPVDSDDRLKAFVFAGEELNIDEDKIYKAWMNEIPMADVNESFENDSWDTSRVTDLVSHYLTEFDSMSIEQLQKKVWVAMEEEGSKLPDLDTFKQYVADTAAHFYEEIDSLGEGYEPSPKIDYNPNHLRDDEGNPKALTRDQAKEIAKFRGHEDDELNPIDESKSINESRPDKDIKTTTNKVTIKYGNSVKEVETCEPIKVTQDQLNGYKDNYSIVDVLDESKSIKESTDSENKNFNSGDAVKIDGYVYPNGFDDYSSRYLVSGTGTIIKELEDNTVQVKITVDGQNTKKDDELIIRKMYVDSINESKSINENDGPIKITPDSKNKEIDIEDKSEVGDVGHPIKKGLGDPLKESANDSMIYLFPELTDEDLEMLKAYGLQLLGINHGAYGDEENWVVRGQESSLRMFADKYLGYELHPDYLYNEDDFAGDIEPLKESITNSPLSTAGPIPYAVKLLYQMDKFVMDVYDNEGWLMNGVPDGEFEETTADEAMQNYNEHAWLIEDEDSPNGVNWDDFNDFIDTFSNVTDSRDYDQEERNRIIDEADTFVREYAKYKD